MKGLFCTLAIVVVTGLLVGFVPAYRVESSVRSQHFTDLETIQPGPLSDLAPELAPLLAFSDANTGRIVDKITQGAGVCSRLSEEYRVDCLSKALRDASYKADQPDYRDARKALRDASQALGEMVKQNADPDKPMVRVGGRTYRAVKKTAVKPVNRRAKAVLDETETKLLRSTGGSLRRTHYQRIAQAVGSTKKLLRS